MTDPSSLAPKAWSATVLTLFPEIFPGSLGHSLAGKALQQGLWSLDTVDIREFARDKHGTVDDTPFGGGPGMVMQVEPLRRAITSATQVRSCDEIIYLSPQGERATQKDVAQLAQNAHTLFVCGRYEGIDQRVVDRDITRELSIGDFVMSGGEFAALCLLDAVSRLIPGVLGNTNSAQQDSFQNGLLDYPHYTRPEQVDGQSVPNVLLSGNHAAIHRWRRQMAIRNTLEKRPDLLAQASLDALDRELLEEIRQKIEKS